jgi:hypothetical protein
VNAEGIFRLEWLRARETKHEEVGVAAESVVTRVVTSGPVYEAVNELEKFLRNPEMHPEVVFWEVGDDVKPRKNINNLKIK